MSIADKRSRLDKIKQKIGYNEYDKDWLTDELEEAWSDIALLEKQSQGRWDKGETLKEHNCKLIEKNDVYREALKRIERMKTFDYNSNHIDSEIHAGLINAHIEFCKDTAEIALKKAEEIK